MGQLWRSEAAEAQITNLVPGSCIAIPIGVRFQFRAIGANELHLLIATMPAWPGAHEALPVTGYWESTESI